MSPHLWFATCVLLAGQDAPVSDDPSTLLAWAVDLPTPDERQDAVDVLMKRDTIDLDAWLAAAAEFMPGVDELGHGQRIVMADLHVEGELEASELVLHVPRSVTLDTPAPLLVALHGAGGSGLQMAGMWQSVADELGAILLAPSEFGPNEGFRGTPRERRAVLEAIRWTRRNYNIDENRIWLTGYSRGGHLTFDLALRFPGVFAAAAPQAGGARFDPARGRNNMRYLDNLTDLPLRAMVGARDEADLVWSLQTFFARIAARGIATADLVVVPDAGHSFNVHGGQDWAAWFGQHTREPWPESLVRRSAREDENQNRWLSIGGFTKEVEETFEPTIRVRRGVTPDQNEVRVMVIDHSENITARVAATFLEPGSIQLDAKQATQVHLLLPAHWLTEKGPFTIRDGSRKKRVKIEPDRRVLLETFVERFDRTFLPVAEARVKVRGR